MVASRVAGRAGRSSGREICDFNQSIEIATAKMVDGDVGVKDLLNNATN